MRGCVKEFKLHCARVTVFHMSIKNIDRLSVCVKIKVRLGVGGCELSVVRCCEKRLSAWGTIGVLAV